MDLTMDKAPQEKRARLDEGGDDRPRLPGGSRDAGNDDNRSQTPQKAALDLSSPHPVQDNPFDLRQNRSLNGTEEVRASDIRFIRMLSEDPLRKFVAFEGEHQEQPVVVTLEKTPFSEEQLREIFSDHSNCAQPLRRSMSNDVYGNYTMFPPSSCTAVRSVVIHPATERHIRKYEHQELHLFSETAELYQSVTRPYLDQHQFSLEWVYNVLEHRAETERIVLEDADSQIGFILSKDLKFTDDSQLSQLHLIALVRRRDLRSIRDLTAEHLPLLENLRTKCQRAITDNFRIEKSQLRAYFHYQPSYYHLHVHWTSMAMVDPPGSGVERAHLLDTVIENIRLVPDYYQRTTLTFSAKKGTELFGLYKEIVQ